MILHLFYKEWIKTRWAFLCVLLLGIASIIYIFTGVDNKITMIGDKALILKILYETPPVIYYFEFLYMPLLAGIAIGISQYVPEVMQKRIRLTLHLPMNNNLLVVTMAAYGLLLLTLCNVIFTGLFFYYNTAVFPDELTYPVLISLTPWLLGSYVIYNFIAMIAMEPSRGRKVIYAIIAWYVLQLFMVGYEPHGAYRAAIPVLLLIAVCSCPLVLYTSSRFNKGEK